MSSNDDNKPGGGDDDAIMPVVVPENDALPTTTTTTVLVAAGVAENAPEEAGSSTASNNCALEEEEEEERKSFNLRESERLLFFTDAVVAIAATLLILPLMEAAMEFGGNKEEGKEETRRLLQGEEMEREASEEEMLTVADFFHENGGHMAAFVTSFLFVAGRFWKGHAFLFSYVEFVSLELFIGNMIWILSVVFLPVAASLLFGREDGANDKVATLSFLGFFWFNAIMFLILKILIRRNPRTWTEKYGPPTEYSLYRSIVYVGLGAITMVVGGTVPNYGWVAIYLYILAKPSFLLIFKLQPRLKQKRSLIDKAHDKYLRASFITPVWRYLCRKSRRSLLTGGTDSHSTKTEKKEDLTSKVPEEQASPTENNDADVPDVAASTDGMTANKLILLRISNRLIIFTDATVAISMTLLIIPLMEKSSELDGTMTAADYFEENAHLCGALVMSFAIIASRWQKHDGMFAFVEGRVPAEFLLFTTPWLLSITFMPVATALFVINENADDRGKYGTYFGTLLFNMLISVALGFIVYLENKQYPPRNLLQEIVATILCAFGLLIAMLVPRTGNYMPLLLFLASPVTSQLLRFWPNADNYLVAKMT